MIQSAKSYPTSSVPIEVGARPDRQEIQIIACPGAAVQSPQLVVSALSHRYGQGSSIFEDLSFRVSPGDFVCVLGPSGCGKSTLLHALAGLVKCEKGSILINGQPVTQAGPDRLLMFQEPALFPWLTVEDNLLFALGSRRLLRLEGRRRAREFIDEVKLTGFEHLYPHQLSGGMKMRASLARALAMDPEILLMDEPLAALDAFTREQMRILLHQIWRDTGKTIVLVTHDVEEAVELGNRVLVMSSAPGRIVEELEVRWPYPRAVDDFGFLEDIRALRRILQSADRRTLHASQLRRP